MEEFKQLKELHVGEDLLKNLFDCNRILKHLPKLATFDVKGFQLNSDMEDNSYDVESTSPLTSYYNIKNLDIARFIDWEDKELLYIMEAFTALEDLFLCGKLKATANVESVSAACIKSFAQFISKIQSTYILLDGLPITNQLMDMYAIYQDDYTSQQDGCELHLSISFLGEGHTFKSRKIFETKFFHHSDPLTSTIEYMYDMTRDPRECKSKLLGILYYYLSI